eukprot:8923027-Alexandrium_andersonii.AAC.1
MQQNSEVPPAQRRHRHSSSRKRKAQQHSAVAWAEELAQDAAGRNPPWELACNRPTPSGNSGKNGGRYDT